MSDNNPVKEVNDYLGLSKGNSDSLEFDQRWFSKDKIDAQRWNKLYPYQLIVVKQTSNGLYEKNTSGPITFTLPIPPQEMSISTPFAISTIATLGGIVEEHNGAPIRNISFTGTTGVLPVRDRGDKYVSAFGGAFGGTISGAQSLVKSVSNLFSGNSDNGLVEESEEVGKWSGYYQFRLLQRFLESYVTLKKNSKNRDLRLALAIWKDEAIYLVTPVMFDVRRSSSSPYEYTYSLSFRAWGRFELDQNSVNVSNIYTPIANDPGAYRRALNKIQDARKVIQRANNLVGSFREDFNTAVSNPLRELALGIKDVMGVAISLADLPAKLIKDLKAPIMEFASMGNSFDLMTNKFKSIDDSVSAAWNDIVDSVSGNAGTGSSYIKPTSVQPTLSETYPSKSERLGSVNATSQITASAVPAIKNAPRPKVPKVADIVDNIVNNPDEYTDFFNVLNIDDLNVPTETQSKINSEIERVSNFNKIDYETKRDSIFQFMTEYSDAIGAGSETYNDNFEVANENLGNVPTDEDYDVLYALNEAVSSLNALAASYTINKNQLTTMDYLAGMASASGIAFTKPISKYAVPFPYGSTLEMMALKYLNDPNRWMEIAALNGLKSPYIDEEGFELTLLTNGMLNMVVVDDITNLKIGQNVWIESNNSSRTKRKITRIEKLGTGYSLILDGDQDLDRYTTMAQAKLTAFLPDTVNSMQLIYIPSEEPASDEDWRTKAIPGVDQFDPIIRVSGVDLLLTQDGDLAMTTDGDCKLAYGMTNLIQRVRTALATTRGSLIHYPNYGFINMVGESTAEVDAKDVAERLKNLLSGDPTFTGVYGVSIFKNGGTIQISFSVGVAGVDQTIPLTIDITS